MCSGFIRLCALSNAGVYTFVNAFLGRILFDFGNWVGHFHTNGAVHSSPSVEAHAHSVGAQAVVRATVRAQFNFTCSSSESGLALALSSGFVAYTILVAVVWASTHVASGTTP